MSIRLQQDLQCLQVDQVQPSTGSVSEAEPIELSGLVDAEWQPDWQSKQRQAQQAAAALQTKVAVVRSVLYLTPLLEEEPASTPLVASSLVHEVMSSMTARASVDQQHDIELQTLCLVALLSLAAQRPAVADVMLLEANGNVLPPSSHEVSGHALLSHIAAGLLRTRSLPQVCPCIACNMTTVGLLLQLPAISMLQFLFLSRIQASAAA